MTSGRSRKPVAPDAQLDHRPPLRLEPERRARPQRRATSSPHAPAALTSIAARDRRPSPVSTRQPSPLAPRRRSAASVRTSPPRAAHRGEAGGVERRDLDVGAARLVPRAGPLRAQARDQPRRARRGRAAAAHSRRPDRRHRSSPRGRSDGARRAGAASGVATPASRVEHRLRRRLSGATGVSPP